MITQLFYKLESSLGSLLTNLYGNYACKKLFSHLKKAERLKVWEFLADDLKKYLESQYANYSVQMLITQSESDSEREMIEKLLYPHFSRLTFNENGIKVLVALLSVLNFSKTDSLIISHIFQNYSQLAINNNSIILCKVLITKCSAMNSKVLKSKLLSTLNSSLHSLLLSQNSSTLLIEMLDCWGLKTCLNLTQTIFNNFIFYSTHPVSSAVVVKFLEVLEIYVS